MTPFKLSKQELKKFNEHLHDCEAIKQDLERAQQAGVPNIEHLLAELESCKERISRLKAAYNPGER